MSRNARNHRPLPGVVGISWLSEGVLPSLPSVKNLRKIPVAGN